VCYREVDVPDEDNNGDSEEEGEGADNGDE
jgi:hypothetical protein